MADGAARGAKIGLKPVSIMSRRRGTVRLVDPIRRLSPGTDTEIVDQCRSEAHAGGVHAGGGGTGSSLKPACGVSPAAEKEIVDRLEPEARPSRVRGGDGGTRNVVQSAAALSPIADTPIVDQSGLAARPEPVHDGGGGTGGALQPNPPLSPAAEMEIADQCRVEARRGGVRDGDGGTGSVPKPEAPMSPVADTIAALIQLQRQRTFCIRTQSRADRSTDHFIARECLGYHTGLPEVERKALMQQAMRIRLAGEKPMKDAAKRGRTRTETQIARAPGDGRDRSSSEAQSRNVPPRSAIPPGAAGWNLEQISPVDAPEPDDDDAAGDRSTHEALTRDVPSDDRRDHCAIESLMVDVPSDGRRDQCSLESLVADVPPLVAPIIQMSFYARTAADTLRKKTEDEMKRLAATLPVAAWQADIKGFGRLGLAIVVAEVGRDLRCYPTVAKLWKRLGLAVIDGERQRRKGDAELAVLHGFVPRRRAEMWSLADSMFRHQWSAGKDGEDGAPAGPYGAVYASRRARTAETHPDWTRKHARDDARRVMFKALVADLWGAWHGRPRPPPLP